MPETRNDELYRALKHKGYPDDFCREIAYRQMNTEMCIRDRCQSVPTNFVISSLHTVSSIRKIKHEKSGSVRISVVFTGEREQYNTCIITALEEKQLLDCINVFKVNRKIKSRLWPWIKIILSIILFFAVFYGDIYAVSYTHLIPLTRYVVLPQKPFI